MERRHFLVKEIQGDYQLKEIDSSIANAINLFGTITGHYHSVESIRWTFYFMNSQVSSQRADAIAAELTNDFLTEYR